MNNGGVGERTEKFRYIGRSTCSGGVGGGGRGGGGGSGIHVI